MYAILGEDDSDCEMLQVLVRRIANDSSVRIGRKGYGSGSELIRKGAKAISTFADLGYERFIICYDSDNAAPAERYDEIVRNVIEPAKIDGIFCALVPTQEIEAWVLADLNAVTQIIKSWRPDHDFPNPEGVPNPKEKIEKMSRRSNNRPLYSHATHNARIAQHLNLQIVAQKCPSALPLFELIQQGKGNYPEIKKPIKDRRDAILEVLKKNATT